jgi:hypothetical protein
VNGPEGYSPALVVCTGAHHPRVLIRRLWLARQVDGYVQVLWQQRGEAAITEWRGSEDGTDTYRFACPSQACSRDVELRHPTLVAALIDAYQRGKVDARGRVVLDIARLDMARLSSQ